MSLKKILRNPKRAFAALARLLIAAPLAASQTSIPSREAKKG